jgi:hypothetical protein
MKISKLLKQVHSSQKKFVEHQNRAVSVLDLLLSRQVRDGGSIQIETPLRFVATLNMGDSVEQGSGN